MSSSEMKLEKYRIPLDQIHQATKNFSPESRIGEGGFGMVHIGKLSKEWQNRTVAIKRHNRGGYQGTNEFLTEVEMVSRFDHPNIISFVGYYDGPKEMIIVYDYAANESLDHYLQNPDKRRSLTWTQRLNISLGAARGLEYLHSGLGEHTRVIHRDVKSANILLDDKLEAKICDFGLSKLGVRNHEHTEIFTKVAGTRFYVDPVYAERSRLKKESDVYSFGVVLFEISSGTLVYHKKRFGHVAEPQYLIDVVRSYYDDDETADGPDKLIDPSIRSHISMKSFHAFNKLAHQCLNLKLKERPTMDQIIRKLEQALQLQLGYEAFSITRSLKDFVIPLEEIKLATADFSRENYIEDGIYGEIYRGQHSELCQNRTMTINRLYTKSYNMDDEFYNEIRMISFFHHPNICGLIGYSDEATERIIVHEYPVNGGLLGHLRRWDTRPPLTWIQRLKIYLGVARGLQYLQKYLGVDNEAISKNINCENILLDQNMEAKICFFGLSIRGVSNRRRLSQLSNMYSLCSILFEIMSGWEPRGGHYEKAPIKSIVKNYKRGEINGYIDRDIRDQIDSRCLNMFDDIAYKMAEAENEESLPSMDLVVQIIEDAAHMQGIEV